MPVPRILVEERLAQGAELALGEDRARHVSTVLRLGPGSQALVFNARDGEWQARILSADKRGLVLAVEKFVRSAHAVPDLDLLFAPVKRHATDLIVEKATELGVARLRPVVTQRTIAETVRLDRLNLIAREAAEQTERFDAPKIFEPLSLARALDGWDHSRRLIFADEQGEAPAMLEAIGGISPFRGEGVSLLIGPEGGFTPEERRMLRALAFVAPVSLGPRILRAETAVIAALTIVQAAWGDWR